MNKNSYGQKGKITVKFTQILTPRIGVRHDVSVAEGNEGVKLNALREDFETFQNKSLFLARVFALRPFMLIYS